MAKNISVYSIFRSMSDLQNCRERLERAGFRNADFAVLYYENSGTKDFSHERHSKAPEGAALGAAIGVVLGAVFGWLSAMGYIPSIDPLVIAGPFVAALAAAGAGAIFGGVIGALVGLALPEYEAKRYIGRVHNGGPLLSVHCDNSHWAESATKIVKESGGVHISKAQEASADFARHDRPLVRRSA
jgi:hypothetical protein